MFFPITFLIGVLGGAAIYTATTLRRHPRQISRRVALALLWFWTAIVVYFTFGTPSGGGQTLNLKPLDVTNSADILDAVLNVLMFAPSGILLALLPVRWHQAALCGFLGSLTIEATQYLTRSGRSADINDLTTNTLGTLIGFACTAAVLTLTPTNHSTHTHTRQQKQDAL
ncbi:VanZ family protein [Streptomyces sp. C36]|uniref:VanZ family protein n=1 Tax=Streptomyces sp. C36 TaxID=3237122 RepID=UPI0034C62515